MRRPGHSLSAGDFRVVRYDLTFAGNWRLTFRWDEGALDVDMEDYH